MSQENTPRTDWKTFAEDVYITRSNNHKMNFSQLDRVFEVNQFLLVPLLERCPKFRTILSFILADRFGFLVQRVENESNVQTWTVEDCRRIGSSFATFLRNCDNEVEALEAWRNHYRLLNSLFEEVTGFEEFMLTIASNTQRDSIYGMVYVDRAIKASEP